MEVEVEINEDVFLPCYRHLLNDTAVDIDFLYGSRDSGKSRDTAQRLIKQCLEADYFRHILCRKTFNTIKDSQWQLLKDVVDEWGLGDLFDFKINPLEIHCLNGNKFIARGFDDPQKIKSLQNPSGAWVEEGNQLNKEDWIILITSIRSNHGKTKIDFTFNPEADGDYREFWLYKDYFSHTTEESFTRTYHVTVAGEEFPITYRATHTTYNDNPFCSPQRKAIYEDLKTTSPYHYRIYALGKWGNLENKAPFVLTFKRDKHLGPTAYNENMELYLFFDFNRNPMCCNVIQWDGDRKVDWIEIIKLPNSNIWSVLDLILLKYPDALYIAGGDSTGSSQSGLVKDLDINSYIKVIKEKLNLNTAQLQFIHNPVVKKNRVLVNWCFQHLDITINPDTCQPLIFDIEFAEMTPKGDLKKLDRDDPSQQLDALDGARYFLNRYFRHLNPLNEKEEDG
jgi:PBSX family phage terminase large subunit